MIRKLKIKVLHIISGDLWAGAEAMAYQLLSKLNKLDSIDLHLIILNEGHLKQSCRQIGIKTHLVDETKIPSIVLAIRAIQIGRKIKPDIIHAHRYKEIILSTLVTGFCGFPKLIATQHGRAELDDELPLYKRYTSKLYHACLQWCFTEAVAVSKDTADYLLQACGLKKKKITIIPNGFELPLKQHVNQGKEQDLLFCIGSAGRLFPVKRFEILIEIASKICRINTQVRFVIAGEGPERKKLQTLISQYGLARQFRLLGHVDDMRGFYNGIDLYINTSMHEGTPMSILEAMANGLPVIAFDVGGLKEIITNGCDGFVINEGNYDLFVAKSLELINNPKRLSDFRKNAYKKVIDRYSATRMVEGYLGLYKRIL